MSAESKALGLTAARPDEIQKTVEICKEINRIDEIRKDLSDKNLWIDVAEFLPTSKQALGFEKKKHGIQKRGSGDNFEGAKKISVDSKLKKAETSIQIEGMDPHRKRQVR